MDKDSPLYDVAKQQEKIVAARKEMMTLLFNAMHTIAETEAGKLLLDHLEGRIHMISFSNNVGSDQIAFDEGQRTYAKFLFDLAKQKKETFQARLQTGKI